jgi:hypothetical protein
MSEYCHNAPGPLYNPPHGWQLVDDKASSFPGYVALGLNGFPVSSGGEMAMPGQPEVANSLNYLTSWQSSGDPHSPDRLDMVGATSRDDANCNPAAQWKHFSALETTLNFQASPTSFCQMFRILSLVRDSRRAVGLTYMSKQADLQYELRPSPLCTINPLFFPPLIQYDCSGGPTATTRGSEAPLPWQPLSRCADNSDISVTAGSGDRVIARDRDPQRPWSSVSDMSYGHRVQQCEVGKMRGSRVSQKGRGTGETRKVQNRQSQRMFRARLKLRNKEVGSAPRVPSASHSCCRVLTPPELIPAPGRRSPLPPRVDQRGVDAAPRRARSARGPPRARKYPTEERTTVGISDGLIVRSSGLGTTRTV